MFVCLYANFDCKSKKYNFGQNFYPTEKVLSSYAFYIKCHTSNNM